MASSHFHSYASQCMMRSKIPFLQPALAHSRPAAREFHATHLAQSRNREIQNPTRNYQISRRCLYRPNLQNSNPSITRKSTIPFNRAYSNIAAEAGEVPDFAFAFDIDGVLLRDSWAVNGATKALRILDRSKIPFILLTNGGGKRESDRVAELSSLLRFPLSEENFIQSHTPFKQYVEGIDSIGALKDKTVLVVGGIGDAVRGVAQMYGFKNVVTPADIYRAQPNIWPFSKVFHSYYNGPSFQPRTQLADPLKIDAIFVFHDPRDWALDTQIILDLLLSKGGILGTYSKKNGDTDLPNNGWQQDGQPALYFSNPDLFWAGSYHLPRLGQGGFQAAFQGVWNATTNGAELKRTVIGKPHAETFKYAERVLNKHRAKLLDGTEEEVGKLKTVYMVGDNPESDIRGANEFNSSSEATWRSILVKTGVYKAGSVPKYKPLITVGDVLDAVRVALMIENFAPALKRGDQHSLRKTLQNIRIARNFSQEHNIS